MQESDKQGTVYIFNNHWSDEKTCTEQMVKGTEREKRVMFIGVYLGKLLAWTIL